MPIRKYVSIHIQDDIKNKTVQGIIDAQYRIGYKPIIMSGWYLIFERISDKKELDEKKELGY